jgi:hypothetical protein
LLVKESPFRLSLLASKAQNQYIVSMDGSTTRKAAARLVFVVGLLLMFLGSSFLLGTLQGIARFFTLRAFFFVIIGAICAFLAIKLNKRSLYLFFAAFFLQVGFFLFLSSLHILPFTFSQSWPLLSVFAGLALFPAGWHRFGAIRTHFVVPSVAFVFLGCFLMVFSFRVVPFSFKRFIIEWWPLLVALMGLILALLALGTKDNEEAPRPGNLTR